MSKILPLLHVRGPAIPKDCELCNEPIVPGNCYPVITGDHVDGYVCDVCFELMEAEQEPFSIN